MAPAVISKRTLLPRALVALAVLAASALSAAGPGIPQAFG